MDCVEVQIDRVVGPTHHFGGLGVGNLASQSHHGQESNPAAAAIQGLDKMRRVAELGIPQLILPPMLRPDWSFLRSVGFSGTKSEILMRAAGESPQLLSASMSCSAMWTANAATVAPSIDTTASNPLVTVANLSASIHRALEPLQTHRQLRLLLGEVCDIRAPLQGGAAMRDEGAANHMRMSRGDGTGGFHLFVYGDGDPMPLLHWPRQTEASVKAIARAHALPPERVFLLKQHPAAIDAGAFHNDVVAMSHHNLLIHHEHAFAEGSEDVLGELQDGFAELNGVELQVVSVADRALSLDDAVATYLFNSQILTPRGDGSGRVLLCPVEVSRHENTRRLVERWRSDGTFDLVEFVDLGQSMDGGGGPACLRLRLPLLQEEIDRLPLAGRWSTELDCRLRESIEHNYCRRVTMENLSREDFADQATAATAEIAAILGDTGRESLGSTS